MQCSSFFPDEDRTQPKHEFLRMKSPAQPFARVSLPLEETSDAGEAAPFGPVRRSVGDFLSSTSFWFPEHPCESAWIEHAPFAFWLVEAHRPSTLVELGTHWGFSFFAFCQAVQAFGLGTHCFAVDTWRGDDHAGRYGEEVFASVREHTDSRYPEFARLIRATFEEAAPLFADGSIDLLHIDGRHYYDDVRHDFDVWLPKMSPRGVVVLHDTQVRGRDFGVHRLWAELRQRYPHFEFLHGHGLGILATGEEVGPRLAALFNAGADEGLVQQIRSAYARLGVGLIEWFNRINQPNVLARKDENIAAHAAELARVNRELAVKNEDIAAHAAELDRVNGELAIKGEEIAAHAAELDRVNGELAIKGEEIAAHAAELARVNRELAVERSVLARAKNELAAERNRAARLSAASAMQAAELDTMKMSASWRITRPLRIAADVLRRFAATGGGRMGRG
jgi:O-antigen biosynthesis protein